MLIKPLIGHALDRTVIEVEGVYVNEGLHGDTLQKKQEPILSNRLRAPSPKLTGLFLIIKYNVEHVRIKWFWAGQSKIISFPARPSH